MAIEGRESLAFGDLDSGMLFKPEWKATHSWTWGQHLVDSGGCYNNRQRKGEVRWDMGMGD